MKEVHQSEGFDVAVGDAAGVGAQDAAGKRSVLVVLAHPSGAFGCQEVLDSVRASKAALVCWAMAAGQELCVAHAGSLPRRRAA